MFKKSTVSDVLIGSVREFSFRDNTSSNSQAFVVATYNPNPIPMIIQGNKIIDPISNAPISIYQQGPISLIDNVFRSRNGALGPTIICNAPKDDGDLFAIDNTFTVDNPIQANRSTIFGTAIVSRNELIDLKEQTLPQSQPNLFRKVFEVPVGSGSLEIQNIINEASTISGSRPVIHIPKGVYKILSTINIPTGCDVQIVGDSYSYVLQWANSNYGTIISVNGPTKATFRDIRLNGNNVGGGIIVSNVDQLGSRIFMHELESHNNQNGLIVRGLDNTVVLVYNSGFTISSGNAVSIEGGSLAANGNSRDGRTIMYSGCNFDNAVNYEITKGGNLSIKDYWYESSLSNKFLNVSGTGMFSMEGSSAANTPLVMTAQQFKLNDFSGIALILNSFISDKIYVIGDVEISGKGYQRFGAKVTTLLEA